MRFCSASIAAFASHGSDQRPRAAWASASSRPGVRSAASLAARGTHAARLHKSGRARCAAAFSGPVGGGAAAFEAISLATSWITVAPRGSRTTASFVSAAMTTAPLVHGTAEITPQSAVIALARIGGAQWESDISRTAHATSAGRETNCGGGAHEGGAWVLSMHAAPLSCPGLEQTPEAS
jgi:hypothetical protein